MIVTSIDAKSVAKTKRLDAAYFNSPGVSAALRLDALSSGGTKSFKIDDVGSVEHVTRFKRVLAASEEPSEPFLRSFDVFEYLPEPADLVSVSRTPDLDTLKIEPGVILLTRSGRNLGPCVLADEYLANFIPSDDLLRIRIGDQAKRLWTFAFLNSPSGQNLLRQDRTGSVISHLSAAQVGIQTIPLLSAVHDHVIDLVGQAHELRGRARKTLSEAVTAVDTTTLSSTGSLASGWTVRASELRGRFDAAFHQSWIKTFRNTANSGDGLRLGDVAKITKPGGRYKTNYVSHEHGRPLLSGRQLLQFLPIAPKHLAESVLRDAAPYKLRTGMIAFQADGRAEESLGQPVLITEERDGWLASGHVGRVLPHDEDDAGWIWASMASQKVRKQIASVACGSVVDALYEEDIENVVLPPRSCVDSTAVLAAWSDFDKANVLMRQALELIESEFQEAQQEGRRDKNR